VVVRRIIAVFSRFEERPEFHRLVGLVVVHGPEPQARQPQEKGGQDDERDEPAKNSFAHFAGAP
jgi:hypothetical protein